MIIVSFSIYVARVLVEERILKFIEDFGCGLKFSKMSFIP